MKNSHTFTSTCVFATVMLSVVSAVSLIGCSTPDARAAQEAGSKVAMCSACHGAEGTSTSVRSPVLASQSADYLAAQLKAFRDHSRADHGGKTFMWPMAASLSDDMIEHLAKYFSALPAPPSEPGSKADQTGKAIFELGIEADGLPACSSCHGDKGQGVAIFPRLAGQHSDYIEVQLQAYADGSRENSVMEPFAKKLAPSSMKAVAAYLASL